MSTKLSKETQGAWIVHHGQKVALDAYGPSEYPAIDEAAKAATLLSRLGETNEAVISMEAVKAVARAAGLNPRFQLEGLLNTLQGKKLIDRAGNDIAVLGVTTRGALAQASELFEDADPSKAERIVVDLAELSSHSPIQRDLAAEYIGDTHELSKADVGELLDKSEQIGFVDAEGAGIDRLIFNGHLFRRGNVEKTTKVLSSLTPSEQTKMNEFGEMLRSRGCIDATEAETTLGKDLFSKLKAASVYDLNTVSNESGEHVYVTSPSAFHKFIDPLIDDTFDMAKALVAALTFGMTKSSYYRGQITMIDALLRKLINGYSVGPASAIGMDYRVLEERRVVALARTGSSFSMRLLKRDVGELALQVLKSGDANVTAMANLPNAPMRGYLGPEASRTGVRVTQNARSRRETYDVLTALRSGRGI